MLAAVQADRGRPVPSRLSINYTAAVDFVQQFVQTSHDNHVTLKLAFVEVKS